MSSSFPFGDWIQPFQIEALGVRGRLVRLGPAVETVLGRHRYPAAVAGMLAETLALTAVLASAFKYDGVFTLQTQGDGAIGMLISDVTSDGKLRGYARFDSDRLAAARPSASGGPVPRLLGAGHLAFTVDQGPDMDRYQGIAELQGATLADCLHAYFRTSEQLQTAIGTAVSPQSRAAALMVQRLPAAKNVLDSADDDWRRAVILMSTVTEAEMLFRQRPLRHGCRCSRDKVAATLGSFARAEVEDMAENGAVTVTCEFCKEDYVFDEAALAELFAP
jgi:molecular chaperone Hsp33